MHNKLLSFSLFLYLASSKLNAALPIYPAEIIGRDLLIPGLAWAGHVGITTAPQVSNVAYQVIEALNENPAIQVNSIANFKSRSSYWGSRYGIADRGRNAFRILSEANFQKKLCPKYTLSAQYYVGKKDSSGNIIQCATFRCDTLVNYAFHWGGYTLPTYAGPTFPRLVFNAFPYGNEDGPLSLEIKTFAPKEERNSIFSFNSREINKMTLEEFIKFSDKPENTLDSEDIENLWNMAKNPVIDVEKRLFLLDYLGIVGNYSLIPKLIEQYSKTSIASLKSMMLRSTQSLYQKYNVPEKNSQAKFLLKEFYQNLLTENNLSQSDAEIILRGICDFSSTSFIVDNLNSINSMFNDPKINLNDHVSIGLKAEFAFRDKQLEAIYIPSIIKSLQKNSNSEMDELFFSYLISRLNGSGIDAINLDSKKNISDYLRSRENIYMNFFNNQEANAPGLFTYGAWLESMSLVRSKSFNDAGKFITEFIKDKNKIEQSFYICGLSNNKYVINIFKSEKLFLDFYKTNNLERNNSKSLSEPGADIVGYAIDKIEEALQHA